MFFPIFIATTMATIVHGDNLTEPTMCGPNRTVVYGCECQQTCLGTPSCQTCMPNTPQCKCKEGYVYDLSGYRCVLPNDCPSYGYGLICMDGENGYSTCAWPGISPEEYAKCMEQNRYREKYSFRPTGCPAGTTQCFDIQYNCPQLQSKTYGPYDVVRVRSCARPGICQSLPTRGCTGADYRCDLCTGSYCNNITIFGNADQKVINTVEQMVAHVVDESKKIFAESQSGAGVFNQKDLLPN